MSDSSVFSAFGAEHVIRVTGLTGRQLSYWDRKGFFPPTYSYGDDGAKPVKVYTFKDLVGLRVISVFLNEHKLSLQYLRKVAEELIRRSAEPWSSLVLGACKGEVVVFNRDSNTAHGVITKQYVLVPIIDQIRHVRSAVAELSKRGTSQVGAIETHRNIVHNARVFSGTRVTVRAVQQFLDAGYNVDAILVEYPSLERQDIEAVIVERNKPHAA